MLSQVSRRMQKTRPRSNTEFTAEFKLTLMSIVMLHLFGKNRDIVAKKLQEIHRLHYISGSNNSLHFKYKHRVYKSEEEADLFSAALPLIKKCTEEMDAYLVENEALENNAAKVGAYINRGLNLCRSVEDLYVVLPSEMQPAFGLTIEEHRPQSKRVVSEDRLAQFRADNKNAHKDLKQRLVMNLILARV